MGTQAIQMIFSLNLDLYYLFVVQQIKCGVLSYKLAWLRESMIFSQETVMIEK